ncbi:alpha/beta fold hydrolase [Reichenbachiella agarivorans]|uniref:Alpha/beta fold hydrolase n=1 Tax=Reichenbachiella agarivorans TaxID=2979464 RepID=A0ABY6CT50_9BACT|nr:alpha/beta fold hydrolase [Reichenbachiella agarivorans]UXP33696.1 alpha/beta fold hydrolase [Reichenbachiella agarivorans]
MQLLNYKTFGEGQPLIIIHGFLGSLDNWLTLGKKFSEDFQVFLIDQRNHGKSFHSDKWDYDAMVEDLEYFIDELGIENPILLGHSMGGKTVMQFTAFHASKVDKLIVADIGPKLYPPHHQQILDGLSAVPIDTIDSRQEAEDVLINYVPDLGTRTFLMKNLNRSSDGFSWKMNLPVLIKNIENVGEALSYQIPIETETLFIRGGNSNYIQDEEWHEIEEIFPHAKLETIADAGHWLHAEQPEEFYTKVMNFIQ